jgi:hypothetical protein
MWIEWDGDLVNMDKIVAITMMTDDETGHEAVTLYRDLESSFTKIFKHPGQGKLEFERLKILVSHDQIFPGAFLET